MIRDAFTMSHAVALFLALLCLSPAKADLGITCEQHPASDSIKRPVLVRSWEFLGKGTAMAVNGRVAYYPRYGELEYRPKDNPSSRKYKGLDFFYIGGSRDYLKDSSLAVLYLQRPAVVYLFVNAKGFMPDMPSKSKMPGWKAEGWASLGTDGMTMNYGLNQKSMFTVTRHAFVFSKKTRGSLNSVKLPHFGWVKRKTRDLMAQGSYHVRVAEANGRASAPPSMFNGVHVLPNARCPDVLHDAWSTTDDNVQDRDTRGKRFGSWHPPWDPCYWCAYDHEHGAAAPFLMKYQPKYGFTEFKNGRGTETNPGFKDFVFEYGPNMVYLSIHAQTSSLRRVGHAFHTMTIVMKNKSSGQLMVELTFKGNFGFLAARKRGKGDQFIPLTPRGKKMMKAQMQRKPYVREFRTINVVDDRVLDRRFQYTYPNPMAGTYEEWVVNAPCTKAAKGGEFTFDIQDPITGIRSLPSKQPVWLGRTYPNEGFRANMGLKRTVRCRDLSVSAKLCRFGKGFKGGYFYTDVLGRKLKRRPGPDAVRQFIRPGFEETISGKYGPSGLWRGLHHQAKEQLFFLPHGYGLDYRVN